MEEKENMKVVEADAIFDAYAEKATGLSEELQIDAVRRFDKHFKTLNDHMWWLTIGIKTSVLMAFISVLMLFIGLFLYAS